MTTAEARAYRHRDGKFIVTITRDGRSRRYRVSPERYKWLRRHFGLTARGGYFSASRFECDLVVR
jgi:hypothetical protein